MEGQSWKSRALEILNMYRNAKAILGGETCRSQHTSVVQFHSAKVKTITDPTGSMVVQREKLRAFVCRVDAIIAVWDEEDREIIRRKYLTGTEVKSDQEVLKSLKRDGYCLPMRRYRNARDGALANLASLLQEVA